MIIAIHASSKLNACKRRRLLQFTQEVCQAAVWRIMYINNILVQRAVIYYTHHFCHHITTCFRCIINTASVWT